MEGHACHISTQENLRSAYRQKYAHICTKHETRKNDEF